jgi:DNA-binding transcriptional LysR family regulator
MRSKPPPISTAALSNLRLADLELFISAARFGSLGKAAALHHISQSAASAAIQRVEAAFQRPLCTHEKRQFALTDEGKQLMPRAEKWLDTLKESVVTLEAPPLRIATTHAIARVTIGATLALGGTELQLMRPDAAYAAVLRDEADVALVPDNAPWEGVIATEVGKGSFRLFSKKKNAPQGAVLLPEDQIEVLTLQQRWQQVYGKPLPVKARLPSWSLIADICFKGTEVGFLPDFLAVPYGLKPVAWQPALTRYRILALYGSGSEAFHHRLEQLLSAWKKAFACEES